MRFSSLHFTFYNKHSSIGCTFILLPGPLESFPFHFIYSKVCIPFLSLSQNLTTTTQLNVISRKGRKKKENLMATFIHLFTKKERFFLLTQSKCILYYTCKVVLVKTHLYILRNQV